MLTAVLGLSGALVYGSADFLGGLAAKRISALLVTAISAFAGLVALLIALLFVGGVWSPTAVLFGMLSGVTGAVAISLLYACLAVGPMSILSPLTAVISAVVPMTVGLIGGDTFAPIGYLALGLALVAVVLVGFIPEKGAVRPSAKSLLMAVGAGAMIGAFIVLIDRTPPDSGLIPLVLNRAVAGTIMCAVIGVLAIRRARRRTVVVGGVDGGVDGGSASVATATRPAAGDGDPPDRRTGIRLAVACGVVDAAANVLLLLGIRSGDLSVMSVLTALYPAGTILLAAVVLKERIAPVQWVGLVLALVAAGMLAIA
ncbi:DMT family transporter [Leifsonia kafniensis]|uniref:DMT family transporter n=1 Tax=Leifsonia kafniensis TaxID=475957 RepID=A0ABP7KVP4_9MICO